MPEWTKWSLWLLNLLQHRRISLPSKIWSQQNALNASKMVISTMHAEKTVMWPVKMWQTGPHCTRLSSVKRPVTSLAERNEVTDITSSKCGLIGNTNEAIVTIGDVECLSLIDTGCMGINVSKSFYRTNLSEKFPLYQLDRILRWPGGHLLNYLGYIEVFIKIPETVELWAPVLVTPDTGYNKQVPLLIGTNVWKEIHLTDLKNTAKDIWKSSIACVAKNQVMEDLMVYSAEKSSSTRIRASS